ncbi:cytochrome b5, partial [Suhomyces tanzawaensis NRRL Y-17324]
QVREHDTPEDLWMILYNKVYDVTAFAKDHPGGVEVLFDCGGVDCTEAFEDVAHSDDAVDMLAPFYLGDIVPEEHKQYANLRVPRA